MDTQAIPHPAPAVEGSQWQQHLPPDSMASALRQPIPTVKSKSSLLKLVGDSDSDEEDDISMADKLGANESSDDEKSTFKARRKFGDARSRKRRPGTAVNVLCSKVRQVAIDRDNAFQQNSACEHDDMEQMVTNRNGRRSMLLLALAPEQPEEYQVEAVVLLAKYLQNDVSGNGKKVLAAGLLPYILPFLKPGVSELKLRNTIAIMNFLAAGPTEHTAEIVRAGVIPLLVEVVKEPRCSDDIKLLAFQVIGNIVGDSEEHRDMVLNQNFDRPLFWMLVEARARGDTGSVDLLFWLLRNLFDYRFPDFTKIPSVMSYIPQMIVLSDPLVGSATQTRSPAMNQTQKASVNICDTFKVITAHGIGKAKVVDDMIDDKLCYKLVDYLSSRNNKIREAVLDSIVNISSGRTEMVNYLLKAGLINNLNLFLQPGAHDDETAATALAIMTNVIRYKSKLQGLLQFNPDIIKMVVLFAFNGSEMAKREANFFLAAAAAMKDAQITQYLLNSGAAHSLIQYFGECCDQNRLPSAFKCLTGIGDLLESGDSMRLPLNPFVEKINDANVLQVLFDQWQRLSGCHLQEIQYNVDDEFEESDSADGAANGAGSRNRKKKPKKSKMASPKRPAHVKDRLHRLIRDYAIRWFMPQIEEIKTNVQAGMQTAVAQQDQNKYEELGKTMEALAGLGSKTSATAPVGGAGTANPGGGGGGSGGSA